jgi:hypothetical protein
VSRNISISRGRATTDADAGDEVRRPPAPYDALDTLREQIGAETRFD